MLTLPYVDWYVLPLKLLMLTSVRLKNLFKVREQKHPVLLQQEASLAQNGKTSLTHWLKHQALNQLLRKPGDVSHIAGPVFI